MALAPGTRVGSFTIEAPLGVGGMGEVYRARDTRLARDVALKVLPELSALDGERLARLTREAQLLASLSHPNIAAIYGLSYFRTLRRIAEQPDITPGGSRLRWLPPVGNQPQTATVHFTLKTLFRSTQHRMILAFYWGIGFAFAAIAVKLPRSLQIAAESLARPWQDTSLPLLVSSIVIMGFAVVAARLTFAIPLDLRANWLFRMLPGQCGPDYITTCRRAFLAISVAPVWVASAGVFFSMWPWRPALGHLAALGMLGLILVEVAVSGTPRIPFTRSYLPGKSRVHIAAYIAAALLLPLALTLARFERDALQSTTSYAGMMAILAAVWIAARWMTGWRVDSEEASPGFEAEPADRLLTLEVWDSRF
jgi:hypothetical protein